jgi:hypothetical protein
MDSLFVYVRVAVRSGGAAGDAQRPNNEVAAAWVICTTVFVPYGRRKKRRSNETRDEVREDRFVQHQIKLIKFATCRKWASLLKEERLCTECTKQFEQRAFYRPSTQEIWPVTRMQNKVICRRAMRTANKYFEVQVLGINNRKSKRY